MNTSRRHVLWIYLLFFFSGAAALGYQMIWVRMFAGGLGHEVPALVAVIAAFLGGMALGAWCFDRPIQTSPVAGRWYGRLELVIGAWALFSAWLIPQVNELALVLSGPAPSWVWQWSVTFALPFLCLLPATAAIGATLPAMDRFLSPLIAGGRCIGGIYAANTLGAVAGTLGSVFFLMPAWGFRLSLLGCSIISIACGVGALMLCNAASAKLERLTDNDAARGHGRAKHRGARAEPRATSNLTFGRIGLTLFFTGLFGIGYELVGIRVLSQVLENTVYTAAVALAVYLFGTALGALCYQRFGRGREPAGVLVHLLCALATACLAGAWLMTFSPALYDGCRGAFGEGLSAVLLSEMIVATMVFGMPTFLMGAIFSHLVQHAKSDRGGVGRAGALNTLGAALAPAIVGVCLLPIVETKWSVVCLSLGYLFFVPYLRGWAWASLSVPILLTFLLPASLRIVDLPSGAELTAYREGVMAAVSVVKTKDGNRSLRVNNRLQMGGTAAVLAERRQAYLPLLLHHDPKQALFFGPGTGTTLGAAAAYPGLETDGVELVPEVIELMPHFAPENQWPFPKPQVALWTADARRFARTTQRRYDVVVADVFHPARDGAGFLYTREHFEAARRCLKPRGLFCQWLPLHQIDATVLRSIVRTFTETFHSTHAFLLHFNVDIPVLALVGAPDALRFSADELDQRLTRTDLRRQLRGVGLDRSMNVLGCLVAGPKELRRFSASAPVSTDHRPVILFAAPRFAARRDIPPHRLLLTLIEECSADVTDVVTSALSTSDENVRKRLTDYIRARDLYLHGLVKEGAGDLSAAIDAYLDSARVSLQFTPGYARCVTIIQVMAGADKAQARRLFQRLEEAQPQQPLGRQMLTPLFEGEGRP